MRNNLLFAFILLLLAPNAFCKGALEKYQGVWQPSYAFNGKIPWFNGSLIIRSDIILFETEGKVLEKWKINSSKQQLIFSNGVQQELYGLQVQKYQNSRLFVFEINQSYGCQPKSILKKDENCTQRDSYERFRLRVCNDPEHSLKDVSSCKIKERYYQFDKKLLEKLSVISENL